MYDTRIIAQSPNPWGVGAPYDIKVKYKLVTSFLPWEVYIDVKWMVHHMLYFAQHAGNIEIADKLLSSSILNTAWQTVYVYKNHKGKLYAQRGRWR